MLCVRVCVVRVHMCVCVCVVCVCVCVCVYMLLVYCIINRLTAYSLYAAVSVGLQVSSNHAVSVVLCLEPACDILYNLYYAYINYGLDYLLDLNDRNTQ